MADIIQNMFGIDPDQLRMQRYQQMQQQNMQMAQMNPFDRASAQISNAAGGATMLGMQAAGMKTRDEQLAEGRQQIASMVTENDPKSYMAAARKANELGDTQAAMALANKAQEVAKEQQAMNYQAAQQKLAEERTRTEYEKPLATKWMPHPTNTSLEIMSQWNPATQEYEPLEGAKGITRKTGSGSGKSANSRSIIDDNPKSPYYGQAILVDINDNNRFIGLDSANSASNVARKESAKKQGAKEGTDIALAPVMQQGLDSVGNAIKLVDTGIYSGAYANINKGVAKYTPGMDKTKVAATEKFLSHVGEIVIPRLQEFGGSDSNEELAYLRKIMAGEITLEKDAIKGILTSAKTKMEKEIARRVDGKEATYSKGFKPATVTQVVVRKYNPTTGRIE